MGDIDKGTGTTPLTSEASSGSCGSFEGIVVGGLEELEDGSTVIVGIDDSVNGMDEVAGIAEPGSGVTDLEDLSLDEGAPRNAAAVDVDVNAALSVLNAGGPVVLLRQAT